jgi:hypothetical protein
MWTLWISKDAEFYVPVLVDFKIPVVTDLGDKMHITKLFEKIRTLYLLGRNPNLACFVRIPVTFYWCILSLR